MSNITLSEIAHICAQVYETTADDMKTAHGPATRDGIASAIAMTAYLARRHTPASYAEIAAYFNRNQERVRAMAKEMGQRRYYNRKTVTALEQAESQIDLVHEARMAKLDKAEDLPLFAERIE